jgi:hypothetical protein
LQVRTDCLLLDLDTTNSGVQDSAERPVERLFENTFEKSWCMPWKCNSKRPSGKLLVAATSQCSARAAPPRHIERSRLNPRREQLPPIARAMPITNILRHEGWKGDIALCLWETTRYDPDPGPSTSTMPRSFSRNLTNPAAQLFDPPPVPHAMYHTRTFVPNHNHHPHYGHFPFRNPPAYYISSHIIPEGAHHQHPAAHNFLI